MSEEDVIKRKIAERLKAAPKFYLYCCVCAGYLYCSTSFHKYVVHFDCRNKPMRYYNVRTEDLPSVQEEN